MSTNVLITSFSPFPTVALSLPHSTLLSSIPTLLASRFKSFPEPRDLHISLLSGPALDSYTTLSDLHTHHVSVRVTPSLRGGKGGFGSQLRAAGGRMSSQKTSNNDSCRDLSGRRLSTVKEAKKLAAYLESEPERKKAASEARKAKIEALERQLGIESSSSKGNEGDKSAGTKRRFDDTEYLEQSREIVDSVKSAVTAGLLKKKKKAKTSHQPSEDTPTAAAL
ncbi:telomere stability and silencing-domain-containing protein [Gautieria morchelliformis]|nr:telomere stability and silencing-domain-containing protein [Gautieria morchelliformis]